MPRISILPALVALAHGLGVATALAGSADNTLNVALTREADWIDVLHSSNTETSLFSTLIYDTLLYYNRQTGAIEPSLAESWTWRDDRTVEFKLRDGVKFHNGEPFDADDVVYTIGFVTNPDNKLRQQKADFGNIASAEKVDAHTVVLHLHEPDPTFENILSSRLIMWPNEYTETNGHEAHGKQPVGTGPYMLKDLQVGSEYVLAANADYFAGARPVPTVGTIDLRVIPEAQTQIAEMMAGNIDMAVSLSPDQAQAVEGVPGLTVQYGGATRLYFISMDVAGRTGDTPLTNAKVRQAVAEAIDHAAIANNLVGHGSKVLTAQCNPVQSMCPDLGAPTYDPAHARALLAEAGYPDGFSVNLISEASLRPIGEAIQGYLADVGIKVTYDQFPLPAWRDKYIGGESTMSFLGWGGGAASSDVSYALGTFFNQSSTDYIRDEQVSTWLAEGAHTVDKEKRAALFRDILTRIREQAYTVPLYSGVATYVVSDAVAFEPPLIDNVDLSLVRWKGQ